MNLNKVYLIGRLAVDPESRTTNTGQNVTTIRMATNRVWTNQAGQKQEQAEFHTVIAWGRLGEIAQEYLVKGRMAMVEGRLQTRSWQGQDGIKRYRTEVIAENIQLGPRAAGTVGTAAPVAAPAAVPLSAKPKKEEEIPVVNENEPIVSGQEVEEAEVNLKDIPF